MEEELKQKIQAIKKWLGSGSINIFGLPFSGKDTHGSEIASFLDGPIIGGGDILRSGATTPQHVLDAINQGNLAPTEEYKSIVLPFLKQEKYEGLPLILSSVGRWEGEEISVIDACKESNHDIKAVLYLNIPEKEARRRWSENKRDRHDDANEEIFDRRLKEFRTKTLPVIKAYDDLGLLIELNATPSIPEVTARIIDNLYALTK